MLASGARGIIFTETVSCPGVVTLTTLMLGRPQDILVVGWTLVVLQALGGRDSLVCWLWRLHACCSSQTEASGGWRGCVQVPAGGSLSAWGALMWLGLTGWGTV